MRDRGIEGKYGGDWWRGWVEGRRGPGASQ